MLILTFSNTVMTFPFSFRLVCSFTFSLPFLYEMLLCSDMYNDTVMNHFENPRNTGEIDQPDGIGTVGNPNCGDMMKLYIKIESGRLVEVRYKTFGCAAAIASSSIASEMVKGKSIDEALALTADEIVTALDGLPSQKVACSVIAPDAIKAAIEDYRRKTESSTD